MNHKWIKDKCVTCGCERQKIMGLYIYSRSNMVADEASSFPCIDWGVENAKTID